jgi:hypothetical protein
MLRKYDVFTAVYNRSATYEVVENCNAITFTNIGADIVTVDGKILYPGTVGTILGDSFSIGGNENEIYSRRLIVVAFVAGATAPALEVTQKYYV